ncbi:MAG: cell division protein FtsX [Flavobacteriaceae bacterium]|nr:cell division protein FtsX [Flavobacteriaceae bacterium]|tara:strand:+ start:4814 stop:5683 length:870 start_codon:yes stop_codon:yes gene_type:complete
MENIQENYTRRKLTSSYISVVISMTVVLFLIGFLGIFILNSKKVSDHFKEQIVLSIFIKDSAKNVQIKQLQKTLSLKKSTRKVIYVSKEEAARRYADEIGEDFLEFLGYNPLLNSVDVFLNAEFVKSGEINHLIQTLEKYDYIDEIIYDEPLLELLEKNIEQISLWIIILSGIFVLVAILLINGSIRLSIFSKRLVIKTMQLVGAHKSFIRRPLITNHILMAILSSFFASSGLMLLIFTIDKNIPDLKLLSNQVELFLIFTFVMITGILITFFSSFFATQRYLKNKIIY